MAKSNPLRPLGFILLVAAIAAGAYYLGQSGQGDNLVKKGRQLVGGTTAQTGHAATPGTDESTNDDPPPTKVPAPGPVRKTPSGVRAPAASSSVVTVRATAFTGDTVKTPAGAKVRLIGVRTPPQGSDAIHAREALIELLGSGDVRLQFENGDRTAAFVWKGDVLVNERMVRNGWSRAGIARFNAAEAAAKYDGANFWSPDGWMGAQP